MRPPIRRINSSYEGVSIHAPTWGATSQRSASRGRRRFQSTHPRGVRPIASLKTARMFRFNPRTHVGCDTFRSVTESKVIGFNPRTHVGCDGHWIQVIAECLKFQSTHPRGVRPAMVALVILFCSFNPRTHVGCDLLHGKSLDIACVSIHAPTWGATYLEAPPMVLNLYVFQSTHPRGVRLLSYTFPKLCRGFQSTHPRGVRRI